MRELRTDWNGASLTVTSTLVPEKMWQASSIDVFLNGDCILRTGGQWKLTGSHSGSFVNDGKRHELKLSWGHAALRSFPVELEIDDQPILKARVFTRNWPLALWPWMVAVALGCYAFMRRG